MAPEAWVGAASRGRSLCAEREAGAWDFPLCPVQLRDRLLSSWDQGWDWRVFLAQPSGPPGRASLHNGLSHQKNVPVGESLCCVTCTFKLVRLLPR